MDLALKNEILHHFKNVIQSVISFTNFTTRSKSNLSISEVKKIANLLYLQALAQELVFENEPLDLKGRIAINPLVDLAFELNKNNFDTLNLDSGSVSELDLPYKSSINLCIIIGEILHSLNQAGVKNLTVRTAVRDESKLEFTFSCPWLTESKDFSEYHKVGLSLAETLLKSDFKTSLVVEISNEILNITFQLNCDYNKTR